TVVMVENIYVFCRCENNFVQLVVFPFSQRKLTVDIFDHDYRAINNDSEIDCANGKQVGGAIVRMQHNEGEQERKRNRERHDDGGAKTDQEKDQDDQHQHHAAEQVVFHRVRGELYQLAAIVIRV